MGRRNQYIQLVKVLYCKLSTIGKQLPSFPHKVRALNHQPQRWEASVLPLHHCGLLYECKDELELYTLLFIMAQSLIIQGATVAEW